MDQAVTPVFREIDIGVDDGFEHSFYRVSLVARSLMAAFVVASLAGLFGRGPLSHATSVSADGHLSVDFEPIARDSTGTQIIFHLRGLPPDATRALLRISAKVVAPMGLASARPAPVRMLGGNQQIGLEFALLPDHADTLIRLQVEPKQIGPIHLRARLDDGAELRWTQFVMP
jgi:hypothetical protein